MDGFIQGQSLQTEHSHAPGTPVGHLFKQPRLKRPLQEMDGLVEETPCIPPLPANTEPVTLASIAGLLRTELAPMRDTVVRLESEVIALSKTVCDKRKDSDAAIASLNL